MLCKHIFINVCVFLHTELKIFKNKLLVYKMNFVNIQFAKICNLIV